MISPFAQNSANCNVSLSLTFFFRRNDNTFFFLYLSPHYLNSFTNLQNIWKIQKRRKRSCSSSPFYFSVSFIFSHENYFYVVKIIMYIGFCIFIQLGGNENTRKEGDSSFKYLKYCHMEEMTDLFCANSKYQLEEGTTSIWLITGKKFTFLVAARLMVLDGHAGGKNQRCEPKVMSLHLGESTILRFYNLKSLSDTLLGTFHLCIVFIIIIPLTQQTFGHIHICGLMLLLMNTSSKDDADYKNLQISIAVPMAEETCRKTKRFH